jgi:hypothetical protein
MVKNLDVTIDWAVATTGTASNRCLRLNTTDSEDSSGFLGLDKTNFTSSTFTVNFADTNLAYVNASNQDYIAYCWAPVEGYSSFGSYTGNGSAEGPFIHTGFKPRWVMYKRTDVTNSWQIQDTARDTDNPVLQRLSANLSDVEYTGTSTSDTFDALSNGFKIRGSNNAINASGGTYIYAAFAEIPTQYLPQ